jgi:hypothetical protein
VDVVTIAKLGGWKSPAHVFQTYGHASDDKTLTDRLFDTEADTPRQHPSQINSLDAKREAHIGEYDHYANTDKSREIRCYLAG